MIDPHEQSQVGVNIDPLVGRILKVPDEICSTGYIKIVGVNTPDNTQQHMRWKYKARMYDPLAPRQHFSWFDVTQEEVDTWLTLNGEKK